MFTPIDLFEEKNIPKVVNCLVLLEGSISLPLPLPLSLFLLRSFAILIHNICIYIHYIYIVVVITGATRKKGLDLPPLRPLDPSRFNIFTEEQLLKAEAILEKTQSTSEFSRPPANDEYKEQEDALKKVLDR